MAKKTRKVLKQQSQQRAIRQAVDNVSTAMSVAAEAEKKAAAGATAVPARAARQAEVKVEDYRYVRADLRRIGLLAGSITVVLVALSFFIH